MSDDHLYEQIKELVVDFSKARADGTITVPELGTLAMSIVEAGAHVVEALGDENVHKEELIKNCEQLFDFYIEPLDIPRVPRFMEGYVDSIARSMISSGIEMLYDSIQREDD